MFGAEAPSSPWIPVLTSPAPPPPPEGSSDLLYWSSLRVQFSWWLKKKFPFSATNNFLAKCSANYHHQLLGDSNVVDIWRQRKIFILSQHFEPEKGCLKQTNKKQLFLCSSCWPAVEESTLLSQPPATAGCTNTLEHWFTFKRQILPFEKDLNFSVNETNQMVGRFVTLFSFP